MLAFLHHDYNHAFALEQTTLDSTTVAMNAIQQAGSAGADVSELVGRFNSAIGILEQAESSNFNSCGSRDECVQTANAMFVSIAQDATVLKEQSDMEANVKLIVSLLFSVLAAFIISLLGLSLYRLAHYYSIRKFLDMEIREEIQK